MNGFEAAIRNALGRSDRTNPEIRARIYQSARHALEAGLRKQGVDDPARISQQRRRLELLISGIEVEEQKAARAAAAADAAPTARAGRVEPDFSQVASEQPAHHGGSRREPGFEPRAVAPQPDDSDLRDARDEGFAASRLETGTHHAHIGHTHDGSGLEEAVDKEASRAAQPRRRRGFFSRLFIFTILLVSILAAAAWLYYSGALISAAERDTSVPNPPATVAEEDFAGHPQAPDGFDPQGGFSGDWVEVFSPADAPKLKVGSAARIEAINAASGPALRIASGRAGTDGDVRIAIPVDILRSMAGKSTTVALTLQSATAGPAVVSVQCQFGSLGNCDRHRFTANQEKFDALFTVDLPRGVTPSSPGTLIVNAGLGGADSRINLFSVRILPGQ